MQAAPLLNVGVLAVTVDMGVSGLGTASAVERARDTDALRFTRIELSGRTAVVGTLESSADVRMVSVLVRRVTEDAPSIELETRLDGSAASGRRVLRFELKFVQVPDLLRNSVRLTARGINTAGAPVVSTSGNGLGHILTFRAGGQRLDPSPTLRAAIDATNARSPVTRPPTAASAPSSVPSAISAQSFGQPWSGPHSAAPAAAALEPSSGASKCWRAVR